MRKGIIRPLVICIFQKDNSILVAEGYDSVKKNYFYRPIGGGIEFGETSSAALAREIEEEVGAAIDHLEYIGTVENLFKFNGETGHEIVFVYDAKFVDTGLYEKGSFIGKEDNGATYKAMWKPLTEFGKGKLRLVPDALLNLIAQTGEGR
ncbi:DNA mismatch repair protein MutT [Virgibacillus phasianinus]|uniref:DNA mismatch repair protein MutT n=1 Tax=Virgibacillus phasianinus TaxID=2017483 RepID=A0A220U680_9BACI|nr:NUDIX hydrolase [Virgibacillus phasianinus]ASK63814.1 DNA mismatch repair protein MutT [Virgibacillus phasianinus]